MYEIPWYIKKKERKLDIQMTPYKIRGEAYVPLTNDLDNTIHTAKYITNNVGETFVKKGYCIVCDEYILQKIYTKTEIKTATLSVPPSPKSVCNDCNTNIITKIMWTWGHLPWIIENKKKLVFGVK